MTVHATYRCGFYADPFTVADLANVVQREANAAHLATLRQDAHEMRLALERARVAIRAALEVGVREQLAAELERRGFGKSAA